MAHPREPDPDLPDPGERRFHSASVGEIESGRVAEHHLSVTLQILAAHGADAVVACEVWATELPSGWPWAILGGLEEVLSLLEGHQVDALAVPEGSTVYPEEPVLQLAGPYPEFGHLETAILGMLGHATGVATAAARANLAAGERPVYATGVGRLHPAVVPVVERAAYIGGCAAVATSKGSELSGAEVVSPIGPELSLLLGEPDAWVAFDEIVDERIPRLVTVGTMEDERASAVAAAEALGEHLAGVRIDSSSTDPGRLAHLVREVRWELDARGRSDVRIVVTGDLDEEAIRGLVRHVDGFGVGPALARAPVVAYELDIVEVEGEPRARRRSLSGRKTLWRCEACGHRGIAPARAQHEPCPRCGGRLESLLAPRLTRGVLEEPPSDPAAIRARALKEAAEAPSP
jgi:nicotinate phosphoribosyltransferase